MEQTNWEQVRIQAAIAAMQGILANKYIAGRFTDGYSTRETTMSEKRLSYESVAYADALIEELKKEK